MTNTKLGELANTVAAALLSYSPRNKTRNDAVNWAKVGGYANKGLTYDFAPVMDDISWYNLYDTYANYGGWGQSDATAPDQHEHGQQLMPLFNQLVKIQRQQVFFSMYFLLMILHW